MICPICRGRYLASQEHKCKYETVLLTPADFGNRVDFGEGKTIADLKTLIAEKSDTIESLSKERVQRMYYQDIVYDVCTILDGIFLNTISNGKSIVCGRFGEPSSEVQDGVKLLGKKLKQALAELGEKEG